MADEQAGAAAERRAPPKENAYSSAVFLTMENLLDKLKLLDYERKFCADKGLAPFARTAFALPAKNSSVQFDNMLDLASWLSAEATGDPNAFKVDTFDDPNTSVNKMMLSLRNLGFALEFPANKLKQGHGEATCNVLDFLANEALKRKGFVWKSPEHEEVAAVEEAEVDEHADVGDIADEAEVVEEEEAMFSELVQEATEEPLESSQREMIAATVDPMQWKTELERVGPRLKLNLSALGKEWRAHIEQTKEHEVKIQATLPTAQAHMQAISVQIKEAVEKMRSKEQSINNQFEALRAEYQTKRNEMKQVEQRFTQSRDNVQTLTNSMGTIQEQLDEMKEDMQSRQSSATDTSPLIQIKHALQNVKNDVLEYELRIGVVSQTLMQAKLRQHKHKHKHHRSKKGSQRASKMADEDLDFEDIDQY